MKKIMTPYVEIYDPTGRLMETMYEGCERYARSTELKMLEAGYTIKVYGRKLTKRELKEDGSGSVQQ